jgi:dienelactone hydrolase
MKTLANVGACTMTVLSVVAASGRAAQTGSQIVAFQSGDLTLHGALFKPEGAGLFPAVLYNHGSAAGMLSQEAFDALGPVFVRHGWVFFGPYRRGQGLSTQAGPYIGDEIAKAEEQGGMAAGAAAMVRLLETDHLDDQLAALAWLWKQPFVSGKRIAIAGNSFGGVETVLAVERESVCAAVDSAGGAQSWASGWGPQASPRSIFVISRTRSCSSTRTAATVTCYEALFERENRRGSQWLFEGRTQVSPTTSILLCSV